MNNALVLNVDDNDGGRLAKTLILERAGFRVIEAVNGSEAIEMAQNSRPNLMLLDMKLPDIHGMEVCRRIKSDVATKSILILQITAAYLSSGEKVRALDGGGDNYLVEPIEPAELVANVKALLRLGQAEAQLRESHRQKDEFLATLAHELRNPLGPIRNATELLRILGKDAPPQHQQVLQTIVRQTDHLVRLVDDLLDVSRITQGKIRLRPEQVELRTFIQTALETVQHTMDQRQHTLTVKLPPQKVILYGDSTRLAQIVLNLLHNAAKFTPVGGNVSLEALLEGDIVVISVADNGIGIEIESQGPIFEMFAQAKHTTDRVQDGLGIGLPLVRTLTELHGGTVSVRSPGSGQGSTFEVRLKATSISTFDTPRGDGMATDASPQGQGGYRILVVDDNADSTEMLGALLEVQGHTVRSCASGYEAIELAKHFDPEIALVDIGLPDISGYEVAAGIRALGNASLINLIALTGYGQEKDKQDAAAAGFDYHIVKPVTLDVLAAWTSRGDKT